MVKVDEVAASGLLKQASTFIQQVGFPVVAFLLMFYVIYVSQAKMTDALLAQTKAMIEMNITMKAFQEKVAAEHIKMQNDITEIKYRDGLKEN